MKITQIKITDFHQFKDLTIDLTYPKGHAKEGQPLDKVCFIGQSGTGKTSLLELIPKFLFNYNTQLITKSGASLIYDKVKVSIVFGIKSEFTGTINYLKPSGNRKTERILANLADRENDTGSEEILDFVNKKWIKGIITKLVYFPANLNYDIESETENTTAKNAIIDFSKENISTVWDLILEKIQQYQEKEIRMRGELSKTVEKSTSNLEAIKVAVKTFEDWQKTEFNPIHDIADNCLDKLLQPFKLRVKREFEFTNKDDIGFIKVEDFNGNEIPNKLWSTGTKQIILSALPLYLLKPEHTVILFDEPERSLYPDMQRRIVDYYSSLTENCQFFYATHSPIIASSFEPWEIVELKFNEEGKIYRELYYEGENHVDNYKWNPKHMRWDDILQRVFDMPDDGAPERKELLNELGRNNIKYRKMEKNGKVESEEAKELLNVITDLRKKLSFWD